MINKMAKKTLFSKMPYHRKERLMTPDNDF